MDVCGWWGEEMTRMLKYVTSAGREAQALGSGGPLQGLCDAWAAAESGSESLITS